MIPRRVPDRRPDPAMLRPQPLRTGPDFWPTPSCLCAALVRHVLPALPRGLVWEPCAGGGQLADALRVAGREVIATDLHGDPALNFLTELPPVIDLAAIVTNGPFNALDAIIARGLAHLDMGYTRAFVLLLRSDHFYARCRVAALNRAHTEVHCCWRPRWIAGSTVSPRFSFTWVTWLRNFAGPPRSLYIVLDDVGSP